VGDGTGPGVVFQAVVECGSQLLFFGSVFMLPHPPPHAPLRNFIVYVE